MNISISKKFAIKLFTNFKIHAMYRRYFFIYNILEYNLSIQNKGFLYTPIIILTTKKGRIL